MCFDTGPGNFFPPFGVLVECRDSKGGVWGVPFRLGEMCLTY